MSTGRKPEHIPLASLDGGAWRDREQAARELLYRYGGTPGWAGGILDKARDKGSHDLSRHQVRYRDETWCVIPLPWTGQGDRTATQGIRPQLPPPAAAEPRSWPDLGEGWNVAEILAALRVVDAHLDANTAQAYRDQPLAGHWSRITKPLDEAIEAKDALAGVTGENPRKGVCDTWEHVLEELGDTACAALLGIQHVTKDTDATWGVFLAALGKALARVPQERPS